MASMGKRYLIEIEFPNADNQLKAGMTGTAYFEGKDGGEVLAIPRESIVGNLQDAKVYVVEDEKAKLKNVMPGVIFGNLIQIKGGLTEGETVIVSGQINLEDGMSITTGVEGSEVMN